MSDFDSDSETELLVLNNRNRVDYETDALIRNNRRNQSRSPRRIPMATILKNIFTCCG
jgi:hypothetical protein